MEILLELGIILAITVLVAGIFRFLKQPLIISYIITGIIISPFFLDIIRSFEIIEIFAKIGVTFLLFIIGLSLSPKVIKEVGKVSLLTGIGQVVFTSVIGFLIAKLLGFSDIVAVYVAIALTFSSTIIIMKLLSDKKDVEKLYGKISIGFLLVQDIFVVILLLAVPVLAQGSSLNDLEPTSIAIDVILILTIMVAGYYGLPKLAKVISKAKEFLFIFAISWGLGIAALFDHLGLSMEIGALVAGIMFSTTPYRFEISSKMKPLRDFFIVIFFVLLGSQMVLEDIGEFIIPIIVFSAFILVGNPIIVMILMGLLNYKKNTSFKAGLTVAQISEFSIIFVMLGVQVGHLDDTILSFITMVGIITIGGSTYLILYSDKVYQYLSKYLSIFEKKNSKSEFTIKTFDGVLFGYGTMGSSVAEIFKNLNLHYLVVDHDPKVIDDLSKKEISCRFGDVGNSEFLADIDLSQSKIVVSTISHLEINLLLLDRIRSVNKKAVVIVVANNPNEANTLYDNDATYVILPHFLGIRHTSEIVEKHGFDHSKYQEFTQNQKKTLDNM